MKKPITRLPRPSTITLQMKRYHNTKDTRILNNVHQYIITNYIQYNQEYNGQSRTIDELASFLGLSVTQVMAYIGNMGKELLQGEGTQSIVTALQLLLLKLGLGHTNRATTQAQLLIKEQADKYVPFLSNAATMAIGQEAQSLGKLMDLYKLFSPNGPGVQVNVQNNLNGPVNNEKAIGPNEAVMLISAEKAHTTLLDDPAMKATLAAKYADIDNGLPEVDARRQIGTNEQIGIVTLPPMPTTLPSKVKRHDIRAEELGEFIPE